MEVKIDCERLAADVRSDKKEKGSMLTLRLPPAMRRAFLDLAKRQYGTSANRLLLAAVRQILAGKYPPKDS